MAAENRLNDPGARVSRAEGMQLMKERRREKVAADMTIEDHQALVGADAAPATDVDTERDADIETARGADERPQEQSVYAIAAKLEAAQPATSAADPATNQPAAATKPAEAETKAPEGETLDLGRKVKLKVNGTEVEKTLAEVIADAQKINAAEDYLQRSRDQLHSINELADQVRAKLVSDPAPAPAAPADTTQPDPAEEGVAALFRGDEDKAKEAFRKLAQGPSLDPAKVVHLVRQQLTLDDARAAFLTAHPDADTDPIAIGVANTCLKLELGKLGVTDVGLLQPAQIKPVFEAAAKAMSAWRGGQTSQPTPTIDPQRASKKAAIDELPAASARATTQETPPKTNSSVIANMRANRPGALPSVH